MGKQAQRYLEVEPFSLREKGFHPDRSQVSESLFSLANEYCGIRGVFDEDISLPSLRGSYFNGILEYEDIQGAENYRGIIKRTHFTINSVDWLKCSLVVHGEKLDLAKVNFSDFERTLDFKTGLLTRRFIWNVYGGHLEITFERLLGMSQCHQAIQRISLKADKEIPISLSFSLDSNVLHWGKKCYWEREEEFQEKDAIGLAVRTPTTKQHLVSVMHIDSEVPLHSSETTDKEVSLAYRFTLEKKKTYVFTRNVINLVDKEGSGKIPEMKNQALTELQELIERGFAGLLHSNSEYFKKVWDRSDIEIDGDEANQQGIRYCIFQLEQTYHGYAKDDNIGAKGLTGEAYSGHAFWDSETYCLPYYLFSNKEAALNLLMFRYHTLPQAKARAQELDCQGACYPIATRTGEEACALWQHASTQFQPSTSVVYAIHHYMNLYQDKAFMQNYGLEMIMEVAKFLLSRGQFNQDGSKFGFYGVMGPDEFKLMVNHNTYTNLMAKRTFEYLFSLLDSGQYQTEKLFRKCDYSKALLERMKEADAKMVILYDEKTKLFEQHQGFFDLPHIDVKSIPETDFPLYSHWSYDRIYRNDMIKQPDVLMFLFLLNQDFTKEQKEANYDYYEPRCIHESSLSPSIHSILAEELGKEQAALSFFGYATRLDLDDYNRNTNEGIHTTSIAAAWMNIVYGFGGLRSDKEILSLSPQIPSIWKKYSFSLSYEGARIHVIVEQHRTTLEIEGNPVTIKLYNQARTLTGRTVIER
jgi:maltose phosphorylase